MTIVEVPLYPLLFILNEVVDDIYVTNNIRLNLQAQDLAVLASVEIP